MWRYQPPSLYFVQNIITPLCICNRISVFIMDNFSFRLTHLNLSSNNLTDTYIRHLTNPIRMFKRGPTGIQILDLSCKDHIDRKKILSSITENLWASAQDLHVSISSIFYYHIKCQELVQKFLKGYNIEGVQNTGFIVKS